MVSKLREGSLRKAAQERGVDVLLFEGGEDDPEIEIEDDWHLYHEELGQEDSVGSPTQVLLGGPGIEWGEVHFPEPYTYDQPGLGKGGRDIAEAAATAHIWGYAVGNDLTRRDLQQVAKDMGRPWDWAKAFDCSAVCGPIHPVAAAGTLTTGAIRTTVNGVVKQDADLDGRLTLAWNVVPAGTVENVRIVQDRVGSDLLNQCVRKAVRRWSFPESSAGAEIEYPVVLRSNG